jgi:putative toxin-antitoxin system antitoxin component (TIGR02293 family)
MQTDTLLGTTLADHEPLKLLEQLSAGLPAATLRQFKRVTRLADADFAALLQVSGRTLSRLKGGKSRLPADLSDRLYSVASVYALAENVFGSGDGARTWLAEPQHGLGGRRPQDLVATEYGRAQVSALLRRIEHGFLA